MEHHRVRPLRHADQPARRGLSRALIDARIDLRWSDSLRVRPLSPGLLELMARAGCASLTVGVESASERVLKAMVKGHRPEHASEMVREAHACEMLLRVNILTCFPGETQGDLMQTRDWVREHAFAIDDLAPSSFYLTADSPVGRRPERFGVHLRGPRPLDGEQRFRKSPDSLTYDEIDGYTWEEREATLEQSEELVRSAWREGGARWGTRARSARRPCWRCAAASRPSGRSTSSWRGRARSRARSPPRRRRRPRSRPR
ncbi:MAG: radical SAM protein [Sandaracinaceae bacterium]|nr:radical SAM protein [Sandaracinaceae bacterium]